MIIHVKNVMIILERNENNKQKRVGIRWKMKKIEELH